jgi:2-keto-4-pentenoate hydratase/2-oxohepta-3-ene-1,7-dioic acid hydratase in catechol pathway
MSVGIDFTARDLQEKQKAKGLPWEIAKSFDNSAVVGKFIPITETTDLKDVNFVLYKNKELVQHGNTKDLVFNFDKLIAYISRFFTLNIGDLVFTGTPEGVGPVEIGDTLEAFVENDSLLEFMVK